MRKRIAASCLALAACVAHGASVTVPSTYDAETDTWIGDVDFLTNTIANASNNLNVYLSKGVYDLSPITNAPMYSASGGGYGAALIYANNGIRFIGATGNPKDVIIKATDSEYRLIALNSNNSMLRNVTVTGGNAAAGHISTYNYRRGGGVLLSGSGTIVSNCIFTANKAAVSGGAVAGPNTLRGTVYDSVFYGNNETPGYGLVASLTTLRNCTFTNNVCTMTAEGDWSGSIAEDCRVYDSYFAYNQGSRTGGVSGGLAVNCRFLFNTQNNPNGSNWGNPGGGGAYNATLTNCYFYGNTAYRIGGAIRSGSVVNCTVISNRTRHASDAYAGGIYGASLVEGCTVSSNISVNGGGMSNCGVVTNTFIACNKANYGGGARSSALTGCTVEHNVAATYEGGNYGGAGGGICYGSATNCVFRDNFCSTSYRTEVLKGCDIADTGVNARIIDSCSIHGVQNDELVRAVGNVAYPNGNVTSNMYMFGGVYEMRNCLVTNCTWKGLKGNHANTAVFTSDGAVTTRVENCTFADNSYYLLSRYFNATNKTLAFVNSVLTGNKQTTRGDFVTMESAYVVLSNCVYGKLGEYTTKAEGFTNYGCTSITARAAYKFTGKDSDPYSLKRSSPLRGWGLLLDWMADGTDLAGNPRLRDGAVDIGCYQCWLDPIGTTFSIR